MKIRRIYVKTYMKYNKLFYKCLSTILAVLLNFFHITHHIYACSYLSSMSFHHTQHLLFQFF